MKSTACSCPWGECRDCSPHPKVLHGKPFDDVSREKLRGEIQRLIRQRHDPIETWENEGGRP